MTTVASSMSRHHPTPPRPLTRHDHHRSLLSLPIPVVFLVCCLLLLPSPLDAMGQLMGRQQQQDPISSATTTTKQLERVCYLVMDHEHREKALEHLNAHLCTRINLMPVIMDSESWQIKLNKPTDLEQFFMPVLALRAVNPQLKVLVTMVSTLGTMASSPETRTIFAQSVADFLDKYSLDGLDIDWEFPVYTSHKLADRENFVLLLGELRRAQGSDKLLTAAVAADQTIGLLAYSVPRMAALLDYVSVMCYDFYFYKKLWPFTGHNAALKPRLTQQGYFRTLNTAAAAIWWHSQGMNKSQIMVGLPTYGLSFKLLHKALHYPGAPAIGAGAEYTYGQLCRDELTQENNNLIVEWDSQARVPYAHRDDLWISFEDSRSAREKGQWIVDNGFGGAMLYSLNADDIEGHCLSDDDDLNRIGRQSFVLHSTLANVFQQHQQQQRP